MGALSGPQSVVWGASGKRMVWGGAGCHSWGSLLPVIPDRDDFGSMPEGLWE